MSAAITFFRMPPKERQKTLLDIAMSAMPSVIDFRFMDFLAEVVARRPFDFEPTNAEREQFERIWTDLVQSNTLAEAVRVSIQRLFRETRVDLLRDAKRDTNSSFLEVRNALGALALLWQIHTFPPGSGDPARARVITRVSIYRQLY